MNDEQALEVLLVHGIASLLLAVAAAWLAALLGVAPAPSWSGAAGSGAPRALGQWLACLPLARLHRLLPPSSYCRRPIGRTSPGKQRPAEKVLLLVPLDLDKPVEVATSVMGRSPMTGSVFS